MKISHNNSPVFAPYHEDPIPQSPMLGMAKYHNGRHCSICGRVFYAKFNFPFREALSYIIASTSTFSPSLTPRAGKYLPRAAQSVTRPTLNNNVHSFRLPQPSNLRKHNTNHKRTPRQAQQHAHRSQRYQRSRELVQAAILRPHNDRKRRRTPRPSPALFSI